MKHSPHCLSLCMIVKNEEKTLLTAIQSVAAAAEEIIIVDTGSTDRTVELARQHATLVIQVPWKSNFAEVRNLCLDEATGEWVLVLDADEVLHSEDIEKLKQIIRRNDHEGYFVQMINRIRQFFGYHEEHFPSVRLFRNRPSYRYNGAIHEQITSSIPFDKLAMSDIRIIHDGYSDPEKSKRRSIRNIRILEQAVAVQPEDDFQRFNLGIEYMVNHEYQKAVEQLKEVNRGVSDRPMWFSRFYKALAYCLIKTEAWKEAKEILKEGMQHLPNFPDLFYLEAMSLIAQNRYKDALYPLYTCLAIGEVTEAGYITEKGMGTFKVHYALGTVYEALQDIPKAKMYFANALQANLTFIDAGVRFMKLYQLENRIGEALRFLGVIYDDQDPTHLLIMAAILMKTKQISLCRRYVEKALKKGAKNDPLFHILGKCYYYEGKWKEMLRTIDQIQDPFYAIHLVELALFMLKENQEHLTLCEEKYPNVEFFKLEIKRWEETIRHWETNETR